MACRSTPAPRSARTRCRNLFTRAWFCCCSLVICSGTCVLHKRQAQYRRFTRLAQGALVGRSNLCRCLLHRELRAGHPTSSPPIYSRTATSRSTRPATTLHPRLAGRLPSETLAASACHTRGRRSAGASFTTASRSHSACTAPRRCSWAWGTGVRSYQPPVIATTPRRALPHAPIVAAPRRA